MHINEGNGMITNPSTNLVEFIDEALPGVPGSTVLAEWGNAVTFEMAAISQAAGLDLATSAAEDRANGWHQMKTAIFDSAALGTAALQDLAITTAKIATGAVNTDKVNSLDLSKLFGTLVLTAVVGGFTTYQIQLDESGLTAIIDIGGGQVGTATYGGGGPSVTGTDGEETKYLKSGMRAVGVGSEAPVKMAVFPMTTSTGVWDQPEVWYGVCTGLKKTKEILNAFVTKDDTTLQGGTSGDGSSIYDAPAVQVGNTHILSDFERAVFSSVDTSDDWQVMCSMRLTNLTPNTSNYKLYVVYSS